MGPHKGFRARLMRGIHAEAAKRRMDHDALHDMCASQFGVRTMAAMTDEQLVGLYRTWTGKLLRSRAPRPRAEVNDDLRMVAAAEMEDLAQQFALRGMGHEGQANFVRRQLRGRDQIRTRGDWRRVIRGVREMNRRDGLI